MPDEPDAYFITIRTYGTWLAGDARGSVDDDHRTVGEPFKPRDDFRRAYQERQLKTAPVEITATTRPLIESAMEEVCEYRSWHLFALNVRTNHIHIVISGSKEPESIMRDLKAYSTRALRKAGKLGPNAPMWAAHGSTVYAWDDREVEACVRYTMDRQGRDLPGSEWRKRIDRRS
jgi:REP element-mobilizing transposase RayT